MNDSITQSFKPAKGLRQGDPLSPYLFLIFANILSLTLIKAKNNKDIHGVKLGRNGVSFTHLLFANDSLLFSKEITSLWKTFSGFLLLFVRSMCEPCQV